MGRFNFLLAFVALGNAAAWSCLEASPKSLVQPSSRRNFFGSVPQSVAVATAVLIQGAQPSFAEGEGVTVAVEPPLAALAGDAKKLFNDGRVFEAQGNMAAAQRLYAKVTKIEPRYIYGWSNLGNTQVAVGDLNTAEASYTTAVTLCRENLATTEKGFGIRRCDDLSILLLNRGSLRLNNNMQKQALDDLESASVLRGKPDGMILQNLARAREVNGFYAQSDRDYNAAISMTANEVNPFWIRSALVKLQLGDIQGGYDLFKRVDNRFPDAPEVKAAYATFLAAKGDQIAAQRKFLEIPDRQRLKFSQSEYMKKVVSWPPVAIDTISKVASAVGDKRS